MGWKTIIIGSDCLASVSMKRMKITIGDEYQTFPLCDIDSVIFSHSKTVITIPLISELLENNINIIVCNQKNDPIGVFQPFNGHSLAFKQLNNQINWKITRKKKLWKKIVELKIKSEIDALNLLGIGGDVCNTLNEYKGSVYNDDQTNREAASARLYFSTLFGTSFTRDTDDNVNYGLNYGYKILASYISKCIASRGLITQLGIHHIGESNPFNLTYDFIEPLRSIVDVWVRLNIKDDFNTYHKRELIELLERKVFIKDKWIRLSDGIEDIVDSYISFLNEDNDEVLSIDLSKGIKSDA